MSDLILSDGQVSAVVVQPANAFGAGYRAFSYQDYGTGWTAGSANYDIPYTEQQAAEVVEFDYNRLE
ncbi:hypothetical protein [Palleronia sp.]|uniref:hypothetical protein n=1 Tax=Palleronia sp. TaxID=1940284 RepID=UPI0035C86C48